MKWVFMLQNRVRDADLWFDRGKMRQNRMEKWFLPAYDEKRATADLLGRLVGVGIVESDSEICCIATRSSKELFMEGWQAYLPTAVGPESVRHVLSQNALRRALEVRYDPRADANYIGGRRDRVQLLKMQHIACELFPVLRNWDAPQPPEITLYPERDGTRIAGALLLTFEESSDEG